MGARVPRAAAPRAPDGPLVGAVQWLLRRYAAREAADVRPFVVGRRILDLGAGEGWVAAALARRGAWVCGADVGPFARAAVP